MTFGWAWTRYSLGAVCVSFCLCVCLFLPHSGCVSLCLCYICLFLSTDNPDNNSYSDLSIFGARSSESLHKKQKQNKQHQQHQHHHHQQKQQNNEKLNNNNNNNTLCPTKEE